MQVIQLSPHAPIVHAATVDTTASTHEIDNERRERFRQGPTVRQQKESRTVRLEHSDMQRCYAMLVWSPFIYRPRGQSLLADPLQPTRFEASRPWESRETRTSSLVGKTRLLNNAVAPDITGTCCMQTFH